MTVKEVIAGLEHYPPELTVWGVTGVHERSEGSVKGVELVGGPRADQGATTHVDLNLRPELRAGAGGDRDTHPVVDRDTPPEPLLTGTRKVPDTGKHAR